MDERVYRQIRAYCLQDLRAYINNPTPSEEEISIKIFLDKLLRNPPPHKINQASKEYFMVIRLFEHKDLTPREVAAAHLFATIANHRANAWHVERSNPQNWPHSTPLDPQRATELNRWTIEAINDYAAFIPECEADMLRGLIKVPAITSSHTPIEANNAVIKVIPQQTEPKTQATPVRAIEPSGKDSLEFIRLATVVARIANCVQLEPHLDDNATAIGDISRAAADKFWKENNPKIEWARSFGVAASMLNKALHDSNMPPQWMEFDNQKRFAVKNDAIKQEGIELLTHATGWGNREQGNYSLHFFNAITQGEDALAMPIARGLNDGLAPDGKMLRFLNIGFDRAELVAFLDKNQIGHNLTPSPAPVPQAALVGAVGASDGVVTDKAAQVRPLQRTAAQDNAIICEIKKQGYDPLALPKNPTGKPGVKAIIRTALSGNKLFGSPNSTIFNKAWERLAARADIVIQK